MALALGSFRRLDLLLLGLFFWFSPPHRNHIGIEWGAIARKVTTERLKRRGEIKDKLLAYQKTGPLGSSDPKEVIGRFRVYLYQVSTVFDMWELHEILGGNTVI